MVTSPYNTYRGYRILKIADIADNLRSMFDVVQRCNTTMVSPRMMHFICEIDDFDIFPSKFIQALKEKFKSEWKKFERNRYEINPEVRRRNIPKIELFYSVEAKDIDNPNFDAFNPDQQHPKIRYNHVHIMLIIDIGNHIYGNKEITSITNRALNRIHGVKKLIIEDDFNIISEDGRVMNRGFLRFRNTRSTTKIGDEFLSLYWHDLKLEFEDALIRASYLCKSSQKPLLPERFNGGSFNVTRVRRNLECA